MTGEERSRVVDLLLAHWRRPVALRGSLPTLADRLRRLLPAEAREAPPGHRAAVEAVLAEAAATDLVAAGLARQVLAAQTAELARPPAAGRGRIRILFLSASPEDLVRLRLDQEIREIDLALQKGAFRDRFELQQHWAVRPSDLQTCLLRHRPHIVHWSGHGQDGALCLEGDDGRVRPVEGALLARLFRLFEADLRCAFLNACYSARQADALAESVDCVVGMSEAVGDRAATRFAASFYQALAFGRDVRSAFELGRLEIDLAGLDEADIPRLVATRRDPSAVVFTG